MCGASRSSSGSAPSYAIGSAPPDASPEDSFDALRREHKFLMRVTDSLMPELGLPRASSCRAALNGLEHAQHSASANSLVNGGGATPPQRARSVAGDAAAPADGLQPPASGIPEHANVAVGYGLCSSLPMAMTKKLNRPDFRADEVRWRDVWRQGCAHLRPRHSTHNAWRAGAGQ